MRITTLMEDTPGRSGLPAEHGLSFYIETESHRLLMDTGASALTLQNADALRIDLAAVDTVVISHGHYDHTGGLVEFAGRNPHAQIYLRRSAQGKYYRGAEKYIGMDKRIASLPRLHLIDDPGRTELNETLSLFSGVLGRRLWPEGNRALHQKVGKSFIQDDFSHEQHLVIREKGKRILLSGCAHSGILNILDRYHELYHGYPDAVLSGFHMVKSTGYSEADIDQILQTAKELSQLPTIFYTGHCTGKAAFDLMETVMGDQLRPLCTGDIICL